MGSPNRVTTPYDLTKLLDLVKRDTLLSTNCHAIGTIQEFDESNQTAKVAVNYKRVNYGKPGDPPTYTDYPLCVDCPVVVLTGGTGVLTFPIAVGDTCLLLFNDRDFDNWFSSGQTMPPATPRLHSFSDAIALVGIRSLKNPIEDYDADRVVLALGDTKLKLGEKVRLENSITDLLTVMLGLIDQIKALTTTNTVPGAPAAISVASQAALETYKTTIEGLLE